MIEIIEEGKRTVIQPREVTMINVASSNVESIGYDLRNSILYVRFLSGAKYGYRRVPKGTFEDMIRAPSKGQFVWYVLRNRGTDTAYDYFLTNDDGNEVRGTNNKFDAGRIIRAVLNNNEPRNPTLAPEPF
jgi:hypothetical protein